MTCLWMHLNRDVLIWAICIKVVSVMAILVGIIFRQGDLSSRVSLLEVIFVASIVSLASRDARAWLIEAVSLGSPAPTSPDQP